jgi:hypothetical protein
LNREIPEGESNWILQVNPIGSLSDPGEGREGPKCLEGVRRGKEKINEEGQRLSD